jgi:hypothetical protein
MKTKVETIDIIAKEWFDKVNGNSYFSATVTVNFGTDTEKTILVPFTGGYGESYVYEGMKQLKQGGYCTEYSGCPSRWCRENGILLRTYKTENCKKRDVITWGQE